MFRKTAWPILSDEKYKMVDEPCKLAIEALDGQCALAGTPVGTPSVCQLPTGPSHIINPPIQEAVSVSLINAAVLDL